MAPTYLWLPRLSSRPVVNLFGGQLRTRFRRRAVGSVSAMSSGWTQDVALAERFQGLEPGADDRHPSAPHAADPGRTDHPLHRLPRHEHPRGHPGRPRLRSTRLTRDDRRAKPLRTVHGHSDPVHRRQRPLPRPRPGRRRTSQGRGVHHEMWCTATHRRTGPPCRTKSTTAALTWHANSTSWHHD
jgi:hypothetical protein